MMIFLRNCQAGRRFIKKANDISFGVCRSSALRSCANLLQKRNHSGHHDHNHDTSKEGSKVTLYGLASNIFLTAFKGISGLHYNSSSLLSDAAHSLADLLSDIVTLITLKQVSKESKNFPFGRGKIESLGGLAVSSLLVSTGITTFLHCFSHEHSILGTRAIIVALVSVFIKEGLFRWNLHIGKKRNSSVLIANAYHHRADALTSVVMLVGVVGGNYFEYFDSLGGAVISLMVLRVGLMSGLDSCRELLDMQDRVNDKIENFLKEKEIDVSTRSRKYGYYYIVDFVIEDEKRWKDCAELSNLVKKRFPRVREVSFTLKNRQ